MKETIAKITKTKSWYFEKINKIDKCMARLIKEKKEKNQNNKLEIKNEKLQLQMFKLVLGKAQEPEIKLPTSTGSSEKQEISKKKHLFLIYGLCQSL